VRIGAKVRHKLRSFKMTPCPVAARRENQSLPCAGYARLQRVSNCYTLKPQLLSGFFLKKKPPCTVSARAHELENRSKRLKVDARARLVSDRAGALDRPH